MNKNYAIEGLRGILMIWIVLYHYTFVYNQLVMGKTVAFTPVFNNGGAVGVELFFVMSGFFLVGPLTNLGGGILDSLKWFSKRYWRLWPAYAISITITFLWMLLLPVPGRVVDFLSYICNLLFIAHPGVDYVDRAHWYIAALVELQFLTAVLCAIKNKKVRVYSLLGILVVLVLLGQASLRLGWERPIELNWFLTGAEGVLIGICIGLIKEYKICIPILGGLFLWLTHLSWLYAFYISLFCLCAYPINGRIDSIKDKILGNRVLAWIGGISFCWYLIHQNIGYSLMYYILPDRTSNLMFLVMPMIATLFFAIIVSFLSDRIIKQFSKKYES